MSSNLRGRLKRLEEARRQPEGVTRFWLLVTGEITERDFFSNGRDPFRARYAAFLETVPPAGIPLPDTVEERIRALEQSTDVVLHGSDYDERPATDDTAGTCP